MGRKGREKMIKEFDKEIVIKHYLDVIDEIFDMRPYVFSPQLQTST
jgi:hypothetical protein